ncbi:hypothetical protein FO519_009855, partial [Halicephalobus sp. NKZ332]
MIEEIESGSISQAYTVTRNDRWTVFLPTLIVLYAIFKEFKIGTPFMYKYQTEVLNYTDATLSGEIYPYYAYAYLFAIVPILLFTDILLYKPVMYFEIFGKLIYRFTLVYTHSLFSQQIGQAMYGIAAASDVAFSSYIYAKFEKDEYKKLTSWTRAGRMVGKATGYFLAQILILTRIGTYKTLNEIGFYVSFIVLTFCFFMPRIRWKHIVSKIAVEQSKESQENYSPLPTTFSEYIVYRLKKIRSDFTKTYSDKSIRKWSFWWAMATCMSLQVALYTQTLFGQAQVGDDTPLNAFADSAYTFTSAVFILLTNCMPINWDKSFYQVMITIAQWNIAKKMTTSNYGLIFGINSLIALILQSILVRIVTDKRGLGMQ